MKKLLLGDEAIAQAALDAGISGVYAYPGTPSTEITAFIQDAPITLERGIHCRWATNEKTAMEAAIGMSYIGKRALVCMKHVGLNVAADAFINAGMTGANGGLVVLVADDPSMHSSQNEQDSRFYGKFAFVPMMEPSNQQEAYDMVHAAFDLSEQFQTPVLMRVTTRLAHSRAGVETREVRAMNPINFPNDSSRYILLPGIARRRYKSILAAQPALEEAALLSRFNKYNEGSDRSMGIIACGIAYNYLNENLQSGNFGYPVVKISQYPIPTKLIERLYDECESILVLEDGYPFIEEQLKGLLNQGKTIKGRLDGTLDRDGELNPDRVAKALGVPIVSTFEMPQVVEMRPPAMCIGCGHRDLYDALNEVLLSFPSHRVFGDIGCYTLGAMPPFRSIHTCVDMGASITMAKGASDGGVFPAIAVIGDSTFAHSGITGLLDAVNAKANMVVIISDNETTGMTGGQESAGLGRIEDICRGVGVDPEHIRLFVPLKKNMEEAKRIILEEINYPGLSVIIPRRECIQTIKKKK